MALITRTMSPLKITMLLHFHSICEPFPGPARTSPAYVQFVRELLRDGLIERPSMPDRLAHPGWAYRTTDKGTVYVKAILDAISEVPLPVQATPQWVMPTSVSDVEEALPRKVKRVFPDFRRS